MAWGDGIMWSCVRRGSSCCRVWKDRWVWPQVGVWLKILEKNRSITTVDILPLCWITESNVMRRWKEVLEGQQVTSRLFSWGTARSSRAEGPKKPKKTKAPKLLLSVKELSGFSGRRLKFNNFTSTKSSWPCWFNRISKFWFSHDE